MKVNRRVPYSFCSLFLLVVCLISGPQVWSQSVNNNAAGLTPAQIEEYQEQAKQLVAFIEFAFNTLGSESVSARDKDVIISESYLKAFRDNKVQIEDDLIENRSVVTNKSVQAYLKDIDFFYKNVNFEYSIQDVSHYARDDGQLFFNVTVNRKLEGVTIDDKNISSNKKRYIEINLDQEARDLKIASIYTTKISEREELTNWWKEVPYEWQDVLRKEISVFSSSFDYRMLREIVNLESLDISGNQYISDLSPLNKLEKLKTLNISNTKVRNLLPIRNLTKLQTLYCSHTNITSLEPIKYLIEIKELECNNTSIIDLQPIANFTQLEKLDCSSTPLTNLEPVKNLTGLKDFKISRTLVQSLDPLSKTKNLVYLDISVTNVKNIDSLSSLTNLLQLNMEKTPVEDLSPLSGLESLKMLIFNNTNVSNLKPLEGITSLERIYCDNTPISQAEATRFMSVNPRCLVIYESEQLRRWWDNLPETWQQVFRKYVDITDTISIETIAEISNLAKLDLSGNQEIVSLEPLRNLIWLQSLDISNTRIANIEPVKFARNLKELNISNTQVNSLTALADMDDLEALNCDNSAVAPQEVDQFIIENPDCLVIYKSSTLILWWNNLSPAWRDLFKGLGKIEGIPTRKQLHEIIFLKTLIVPDNTPLEDLEPLSQFIRLRELQFTNTQVADLSPISNLTELESLTCSKNPINNLAPLQGLGNLKYLNFENTRVEDLKPIRDLTDLVELNCAGTQVTSLKYLSSLINLRVLNCYNTFIRKLKPLRRINSLTSLKCYNTRVSDSEVSDFKSEHPDCEVVFY